MAIDVDMQQAFGDIPPPGVGSWKFWNPGGPLPVVCTVTGFAGAAASVTAEILWKPYSDTTAVLTPQASPNENVFDLVPGCDWEGGSYRLRFTDAAGESVTRTFSIKPFNLGAPISGAGLGAPAPVPSPMELADGTTTIGNVDADRIRDAETNALLENAHLGWNDPTATPTPNGSPWGWYAYVQQLARATYTPNNPSSIFTPTPAECMVYQYTDDPADLPTLNDVGIAVYATGAGQGQIVGKPGFVAPPAAEYYTDYLGVYCGDLTPADWTPGDARLIAVKYGGWSQIQYTDTGATGATLTPLAPDPTQPGGLVTVAPGTPAVARVWVPSLVGVAVPAMAAIPPAFVGVGVEQDFGILGPVVG